MLPRYAKPCRQQRGISLLEALITLLLMSIIGIGTAYIAAKAAVAQRHSSSLHLTVSQLREALSRGECRSTTPRSSELPLGGGSVQASCQSVLTTLSVVPLSGGMASQTVSVAMPAIRASGSLLEGEVRIDPQGS